MPCSERLFSVRRVAGSGSFLESVSGHTRSVDRGVGLGFEVIRVVLSDDLLHLLGEGSERRLRELQVSPQARLFPPQSGVKLAHSSNGQRRQFLAHRLRDVKIGYREVCGHEPALCYQHIPSHPAQQSKSHLLPTLGREWCVLGVRVEHECPTRALQLGDNFQARIIPEKVAIGEPLHRCRTTASSLSRGQCVHNNVVPINLDPSISLSVSTADRAAMFRQGHCAESCITAAAFP